MELRLTNQEEMSKPPYRVSGEESTVTLHSKLQFGLFLEFSAVETRASTSVFGSG